jgi:hypothetical protein
MLQKQNFLYKMSLNVINDFKFFIFKLLINFIFFKIKLDFKFLKDIKYHIISLI